MLLVVVVLMLMMMIKSTQAQCSGSTVFCSLIFESNSPLCAAAGCRQSPPQNNCNGPASKTCAQIDREDVCNAVRCSWSGLTTTTTTTSLAATTTTPFVRSTTTNGAGGGPTPAIRTTTTTTGTDESSEVSAEEYPWIVPVVWVSVCLTVFTCQWCMKRRRQASLGSLWKKSSSSSLYTSQDELVLSTPTRSPLYAEAPMFAAEEPIAVAPPAYAVAVHPDEDPDVMLLREFYSGVLIAKDGPASRFDGDFLDTAALDSFTRQLASSAPAIEIASETPWILPAWLAQWASQKAVATGGPLINSATAFSAGSGLGDSLSFDRIQAQLLQLSITQRRTIKLAFQILHEIEAKAPRCTPQKLAHQVGFSFTKMSTSGASVAQAVCEVLIVRANDIDDGSGDAAFWKRPDVTTINTNTTTTTTTPAAMEAGLVSTSSIAAPPDTTTSSAVAAPASTEKDSDGSHESQSQEYDSSEDEDDQARRQTTD
jgi:hypothetical protein